MCPTVCMKEFIKFNPYRVSIRGPLCRIHVQESPHDTEHFQMCGALVYVEVSVRIHLCKDIVYKYV